jgi:hypothetical protein
VLHVYTRILKQTQIVDLNLGSSAPAIRGVTPLKEEDAPVARIRNRPTFHIALDLDVITRYVQRNACHTAI